MSNRTDIDIPALKKSLLAHQEELAHDILTSAESRAPVELDQSKVGRLSRMDALQSQAMALETERRREIQLARTVSALQRIEDNDYGYCLSCDEDISAKRLTLDPATPICIRCAEKA